jgi:predicted nucleic acid-binding protein
VKVLIDACVLYPTVLRELVLGTAAQGLFTPLWSDRILEEWRRAALRKSAPDGVIAEGEIARLRVQFPKAGVEGSDQTQATLYLPDENDIHVLAAAIDGGAEALLTLNTKDFPLRTLGAHGILRRHPDEFLLEAARLDRDGLARLANEVLGEAGNHGIDVSNPRALMKRAQVPRFGKFLYP